MPKSPSSTAAPATGLKFKIFSQPFFREISGLHRVISTNPIVPILSNFLLEIKEKELTITASDLYTSMVVTLPIEATGKGRIAVPATMLVETLRNLPEQPIEVQLNMSNYTLTLVAANGTYKIACDNADNFPDIPRREEQGGLGIDLEVLKKAIKQTLFAASKDSIRPSLCGINIVVNREGMTWAATDGYRLVRHTCREVTSSKEVNVTLPTKSLQLLSQLGVPGEKQTIQFGVSKKNAFFWIERLQIVIGVIDETYPDYDNIIPRNNPHKMTVSNSSLSNALKVIYHYANKSTRQIRLALFADHLAIYAEDLEFLNEAEVQVACRYEGPSLQIGLNSKMLLEMLNSLTEDKIDLYFDTPSRGVVLKVADETQDTSCQLLMLIMPIFLKEGQR